MTPSKVLVTGAAGFIGSRFCERMTLHYEIPYRAFVRGFARATRIARLDPEMLGGELSEPDAVRRAVTGCDAVVHLAHPEAHYAVRDTRALVHHCKALGIRRFIHISSMAVHGPHPGPECSREETATIGRYRNSYSDSKAAVEEVIQRAIDRGFPAVILRPTIVYGPYSPHVSTIVERARHGEISLIDEGRWVCNAVYVDDVCDAIRAALLSDTAVGQAMFVNADTPVSWRDFNLVFGQMVRPTPPVRNYVSEKVRAHWQAGRPSWRTNVAAMKDLLLSPTFQQQLASVPVIDAILGLGKSELKKVLSEKRVLLLQSRMRLLEAAGTEKTGAVSMPDDGRLRRETFPIFFSNERAKRVLRWSPAYDFCRGSNVTRAWLEFARLLEAID